MASDRILLVQPRWLHQNSAAVQIAALHEKSPRARFMLLAETPPETASGLLPDGIRLIFRSLPPRGKRGVAQALRLMLWLRGRRFEQAIVLTQDYQGEIGYLEAKVYALLARAKRRRLGNLRELRWAEEFTDKWQRGLPILMARSLMAARTPLVGLPRAEMLPVEVQHTAQTMQTRLRAFVYLHEAERLRAASGGRLHLAPACDSWREFAAEWGWLVCDTPELCDVLIRADGEGADIPAAAQMPAGTLCLWHAAPTADAPPQAAEAGWEVADSHDSYFVAGRFDVWLRAAVGKTDSVPMPAESKKVVTTREADS